MACSIETLVGKRVLISGASSGIGRATALGLAPMGPELVLLCRNKEKGEAVVREIKALGASGDVHLLLADLSLQSEIHKVAEEFKSRFDRLHVLVNNAGAMFQKRHVTAEGFERTWALNHLAYFLLTHLLLDTIKQSAPARIVSVSSTAHKSATINFDDLQSEKNFGPFRAYGQSKLANILFTRELARQLEGTGVTANCLHPGVVNTGFGKNDGGIFEKLVKIAAPFFISADKGAQTSVYLASSREVEGISGEYFAKCKVARTTREARDESVAKRLWQVSWEQINGGKTRS